MRDRFGREIDYVRISVTDRCNLRCRYCMPETDIRFLPQEELMTDGEICLICRELANLGIRRVKLTGGEPLLRDGIDRLAAAVRQIPGIEQVTLTTNGVLLGDYAARLAAAGVAGINVSLDTTDAGRYERLTGSACLDQVLEGIRTALKHGLTVKINCVPMRGGAMEEDIVGVAALAREMPVHVRYIEMMPVGRGQTADGPGEEQIRSVLERRFGVLHLFADSLGNGPGVYRSLEGFQGKIGFISAVSHPFCGSCNRIRLTADGRLKTCLQYGAQTELRPLLRNGSAELRRTLEAAILEKPRCHHFEEENICGGEQRQMFQIGG